MVFGTDKLIAEAAEWSGLDLKGRQIIEGGNRPWRLSALKVPQLPKKMEFYVFELLALGFGASASQFFFHEIRWPQILVCGLGYVASFAMMVRVRCVHCREPVGKVDGKWVPVASQACSKCGHDHG
jgi:hypothetical protein